MYDHTHAVASPSTGNTRNISHHTWNNGDSVHLRPPPRHKVRGVSSNRGELTTVPCCHTHITQPHSHVHLNATSTQRAKKTDTKWRSSELTTVYLCSLSPVATHTLPDLHLLATSTQWATKRHKVRGAAGSLSLCLLLPPQQIELTTVYELWHTRIKAHTELSFQQTLSCDSNMCL